MSPEPNLFVLGFFPYGRVWLFNDQRSEHFCLFIRASAINWCFCSKVKTTNLVNYFRSVWTLTILEHIEKLCDDHSIFGSTRRERQVLYITHCVASINQTSKFTWRSTKKQHQNASEQIWIIFFLWFVPICVQIDENDSFTSAKKTNKF